jgi:hypothetical protein
LLKVALSFIKAINRKYNMKCITLKDNSFIDCKHVKISLSKMSILSDGNTWYGRYGFRPMKNLEYEIDDELNNKYEKNIKIIKRSLVKDIKNIKKYVIDAFNNKSYSKYLEDIDIKKVMNGIDKYYDKSISLFMKSLIQTYKTGCFLYYMIYEKVFRDLELYDFYGKTYIMKL